MNEKVIAFGAFHPVPSFLFLMSLIVIAVFMANPVAVGILLLGALLFSAAIQGRKFFSDIAFYLVLFILLSLANPLFSHNGATPLFFLNGNPVTLEAVLYGADIAAVEFDRTAVGFQLQAGGGCCAVECDIAVVADSNADGAVAVAAVDDLNLAGMVAAADIQRISAQAVTV